MSETFPGRLEALARRHPDAPALREKDRGIWIDTTWAGYRDRVARAAWALWQWGLRPGEHACILSDNRPEWLITDLAIQACGARSVGIYQTNPASEVAWLLEHCGAEILFAEDQEQIDKVVEHDAPLPSLRTLVAYDPRGTLHYSDERLVAWQDFLGDEPPEGWWLGRIEALDPDEAAMVVYTSGTTGTPKGALLSAHNALAGAEVMAPMLGLGPDDLVLSYLPLCHVAEKIFSLFLPLQVGCVVHFGESIETVRTDLGEVQPTIFLGVPRIWEKMYASVQLKMKDASWFKAALFRWAQRTRGGWQLALADVLVYRPLRHRLGLSRCRLPISGAAPIAPELLAWFTSIGVPILEGYGQTECAGVSHLTPPGDVRKGKIGPAIACTPCQIADDGEILVSGPTVFKGYLNDPEATAKTVIDGWLYTGDLGALDADGYLSITGRKKEILITAGGKNLSPERIENVLKTSLYIKEAVALGDGQKFVAALIQVDADATVDWASRQGLGTTSFEDLVSRSEVVGLIQQEVNRVNEGLARVEQVRAFRLLPRELHQDNGELTATQKIRRRAVSEIWSELTDQIYQGRSQ
jgi:long-chain acyl-CoA synthetase